MTVWGSKCGGPLKHLGPRGPDEIDLLTCIPITKEFSVYVCEPVSLYLRIRS